MYGFSPYSDAELVLSHGERTYIDEGAERYIARIAPSKDLAKETEDG